MRLHITGRLHDFQLIFSWMLVKALLNQFRGKMAFSGFLGIPFPLIYPSNVLGWQLRLFRVLALGGAGSNVCG